MDYLLISFSHKNTNIVDRDSISFKDDKQLNIFMNRAKSYLTEIMILNTCNRVEFLITTSQIDKTIKNILMDISQYSKLEIEKLQNLAHIYQNDSAINHLFSVISSLESLVIGETQIVGQIKDAFRFAFNNGFADQKISRAIHHGFKCSALVRQNTAISKHKVSIASVAVSKAESTLKTLQNVEALVIGSGEMSRLISQYLSSKGANVTLTNRTQEKAEKIAKEIGNIEVQPFTNLAKLVNEKPLIFTATSSENPIISKSMIEDLDKERFWFDLAVPKDIDDCHIPKIRIFRVDDLQDTVNKNIDERQEEISESHKIVGEMTLKFFQWIQTLSVKPLIKNIYLKAENSISDEVSKAIKKGFIPKDLEENVQKIAEQSIKKMLHGMSKNLKKISNDSSADTVIESINYLFNLDSHKSVRNSYKCDYAMSGKSSLLGISIEK